LLLSDVVDIVFLAAGNLYWVLFLQTTC